MKFFILIQLIALIGLSSQFHTWSFEETFQYPIKAVSVIRGEYKDPVSNQLRQIRGIVRFVQESAKSGVAVSVDIRGFPEHDGKQEIRRGMHIHALGISDFSDNVTAVCGSTGPHFNPTNMTHGLLKAPIRHNGDLGNQMVNRNGTIVDNYVDDKLVLYGVHSIIGRSIVLHSGEDDGGLKDTDASRNFGSSGPRIACGVIGLEKTEVKSAARNLLNVLTGDYLPLTPFISLESDDDHDDDDDDKNSTVVVDGNKVGFEVDFDQLEELSKSLPQAVPMFKLFYGILKNVVDTTRESNLQILSLLSQLPIVNIESSSTSVPSLTPSVSITTNSPTLQQGRTVLNKPLA